MLPDKTGESILLTSLQPPAIWDSTEFKLLLLDEPGALPGFVQAIHEHRMSTGNTHSAVLHLYMHLLKIFTVKVNKKKMHRLSMARNAVSKSRKFSQLWINCKSKESLINFKSS